MPSIKTGEGSLPHLVVSLKDDPNVVAEAARDDYADHVVPRTWRIGRSGLIFAWSALLAAMFWVVLAATTAVIVGTVQAVIGIVLAAVVYSAIAYFMHKTAALSGLSVGLFSRSLFGYGGAAIVNLVYALTILWFAVFEASVVAVAFQTFFGGPIQLWYVVVVFLAVPLAIGGVRVWLEKLNKWLLPIYAAGLIASVVWATLVHGYHSAWITAAPSAPIHLAGPGWLYAFVVYMGVFAALMIAFDFSRMGKTKDVKFNGLGTFGPIFWILAFLANGLAGIYLASVLPESGGVSEVGVVIGIVKLMGGFGLVFIFATQSKINSANLYVASSNLESFFARAFKLTLPRWLWLLIVGVVMLAVMFTNVFSFILQFLSYQGVVIVAWTAIALVHIGYLSLRKAGPNSRLIEFRPGRVPAVNPGGLGAWIISSATGIVLLITNTPFGGSYALIITFVLAALIYGLALLGARPGWFTLNRPFDPRDEVGDIWESRIECHVCSKSYIAVEMDRDPMAGHEAICAACANELGFRSAARRESEQSTRSAV
jgi:purine-cytosine permease-like protein